MFFSLGDRWDIGHKAFTVDAVYRRFTDQLTFQTKHVSGGTRYTIYTVTLHPVAGGGAPVDDIGGDAFPSP